MASQEASAHPVEAPQGRVLKRTHLSGGRNVGFLLWSSCMCGAPNRPEHLCQGSHNIVYFHGWPSSAQEARLVAGSEWSWAQGLSVACMDRPGVGMSDLDPKGLSFSGVAEDVAAIMQELGWRRAVMVGTSGGGPHAAACAALLSPRGLVSGLVLVASMTATCGPHSPPHLLRGMDWGNRLGYACIIHAPTLTRMGLMAGAAIMRHAALPLARWLLPPPPAAPVAGRGAVGLPVGPAMGSPVGASAALLPGGAAVGAAVSGAGVVAAAPAGARGDKEDQRQKRQQQQQQQQEQQGGARVDRSVVGLALRVGSVGLPPADRQALTTRPEVVPVLGAMLTSVFGAPGYGAGLWQDMRLTSQPWTGFSLSDIHVPTLVVQGTADVNVTVAMARDLAANIPGAHLPQLRDMIPDRPDLIRPPQPTTAARVAIAEGKVSSLMMPSDAMLPPPASGTTTTTAAATTTSSAVTAAAAGGRDGYSGAGGGRRQQQQQQEAGSGGAGAAASSPPAGLVLVEGEGHMSLVLNHMPALLRCAARLQDINDTTLLQQGSNNNI